MSWNSDPPRGGPMVNVDGFPGPLYPPDHPKGPSPNTDFVLALKRGSARAGAWPWQPDEWDDQYSNRFAHGDGWNHQTHAGVEGMQKWSGTLDPTGNVGEKTFNFYRSVRVPQGRTHAGEPILDSVCVNLINAAWEQTRKPQTTLRELALELATGELGYAETGTNDNKYGRWYGVNHQPWCAIFCTWCFDGPEQAGPDSPSFSHTAARYAYVPYVVADARGGRYGLVTTSSPIPGDLVCYDWNWNGEHDHIGIFEAWTEQQPAGAVFTAIEGNTSTSNNSNGGQVMRRTRNRNAQGTVFVRVAEP